MYKETLRLELALPLPESWTAMGIKVEVQFDVYIYSLYLCIRRSGTTGSLPKADARKGFRTSALRDGGYFLRSGHPGIFGVVIKIEP